MCVCVCPPSPPLVFVCVQGGRRGGPRHLWSGQVVLQMPQCGGPALLLLLSLPFPCLLLLSILWLMPMQAELADLKAVQEKLESEAAELRAQVGGWACTNYICCGAILSVSVRVQKGAATPYASCPALATRILNDAHKTHMPHPALPCLCPALPCLALLQAEEAVTSSRWTKEREAKKEAEWDARLKEAYK